jgi:hypothetical protein
MRTIMKLNRSLPSLVVSISIAFCCVCAAQLKSREAAQPKHPAAAAQPAGQLASDQQVRAYVAAMRDELSRGKVGLITSVMRLNGDEASKFWPIYQEYEMELFELGDARVNAIRRFAADQQSGALDSAEASRLGEAFFDFETKRLELLRKHYDEIAKTISPARAAQFTQVEYRVGTVVDLLIASQTPLIQSQPTVATQPSREAKVEQ